ncbi:dTDP-glucose 4,6-dehydratase [Fundidesulfovibrio soli]|uniref:dTDP-glucose 4,6-dehydratase n=1 Tax=Fundidesulfovibrio soli TaxID=2922716 RepID=UPI001FB0244C|nr:dTDP-glucose 4,6-dehydratase [Fundidesulfovibrio soli]
MRLLVTGGCGFIGTNFVYMMLEKHPEAVIVNLDKLTYAGNRFNLLPVERQYGGSRYHFIHGDIGNAELVAHAITTHKIDAVVNFAAESHVDRSIADSTPFVLTNVLGTQTLLETARRLGVPKFVHVSTDEVYGTLGPTGKFTEETPIAPNSPYSASKASADLICRAFHETYGYAVTITRCSNNYGPYQFPEKLIPLMILKASRGESLPVYGDGMNVRDWIYVTDHCLGVELTLLKGRPGQAYNFGGNAEKPNIEVVKTILASLGKPESLISYVTDRPGHDRRYAMDYSLAQRELGFEPEVTFEQGIARTLAWYKENTDWLEQVQSGAYRAFMDTWYGERK